MSIQKRNRKKEAFFHCKDRAKERYGLILTKDIYENMVRSVHKVTYDYE